MRVLTIVNGFPWPREPHNGVFVLRQIQALMARGHEFRVLRPLPYAPGWVSRWKKRHVDVPERYEYEGQSVHVLRALVPPRMYGLGLMRRQLSAAIVQEIETFRPDLIHAHTILAPGYLAINRAIPVVVTAHGGDAYIQPYRREGLLRAARSVMIGATELVATSRFIQGHLSRLGARRSSVIYNGADENVFFPRERRAARNRRGIDLDRFVIVFVGNLLQAKGVSELAGALERIADLRPLLLVAGMGPERESLEVRLRAAAVDARFLGSVTHDALADIYGAADAIALPTHAEGFPVVLSEAMLSGRVVVTTPVGGIPEILVDGRNGMLVEVGDVESLANALRSIHRFPEMRDRIERQAFLDASRQLTWRLNAEAYESIYARASARSPSIMQAG